MTEVGNRDPDECVIATGIGLVRPNEPTEVRSARPGAAERGGTIYVA